MIPDKIITLANKAVYHRFIAMERSLRAAGCNLPLWVIPYNNEIFNLPPNAEWVKNDGLFEWLSSLKLRGVYRKYLCLLESNYLFVDSDVIFLRNPISVLEPVNGFITSCGHWKDTSHTTTLESKAIISAKSSNWQTLVFNTGQFACDRALYTLDSLMDTALSEGHRHTCLNQGFHEQPGINLLVNLGGVNITNLTLPPYKMESTWAGDYTMNDFEKYWTDESRKPFIIHWAGRNGELTCRIDYLFFNYLTEQEKKQWKPVAPKQNGRWQRLKQKCKAIYHAFK